MKAIPYPRPEPEPGVSTQAHPTLIPDLKQMLLVRHA